MKTQSLVTLMLIGIILFTNRANSQDNKTKPPSNLKQLTIGITNNPPLSFVNEDGDFKGYTIEILDEIAGKEGMQVTWELHSWKDLVEKLKKHEIDMVTSVAYTKERTQYMEYSKNSFFIGWSQVFLPSDSEIEIFLDLNNKKIAVMRGGINGENLIKRCQKFEIQCNIVEVENYEMVFELVASGEVDAAVSSNLSGTWYSNKFDVMVSSIVFGATKDYVAIPKGSDSTALKVFDKYIGEWKGDKNSFYYQSQSKWLRAKYEVNHTKDMWYGGLGLVLLSLFAFLTAIVFKRQVARRAKEISIRNEQFSQIINLVPHIIYVADESGNILLANKKAGQYFGMTKYEIERCSIENYKSHHYEEKMFLNDNSLSQQFGETELTEVTTRDFRDNQYTLLLSKMPFTGLRKNYKTHVTVAVDITEIKEYEETIINLAHYNQVTGLPNKALFKIKLEESIDLYKTHKKFGALLHIGLDSFKKINDTHGYAFGDVLLRMLVRRLESNLEGCKTLAHLGGDEFVIDIPELHEEEVVAEMLSVQFAKLVQELVSKYIAVEEMVLQLSTCIGIVIYPKDGNTEEILMQRVGTALHEAKNIGTNELKLFDKDLERKIKSHHLLESELRLALDKKQFIAYYQPILTSSSRTRKIVGAEALIRWRHPSLGLIKPNDFIGIAEKIGLIVQIGDWMLEQACLRIKENIIAGKKDFFIAINVSALQLKNKIFYQRVANLIEKYNIPPNSIELEITESVLMEDIDSSISLFNKLKLLGVKISIDDFGTGYSSFSYLMKLPIDKIKIDRSFVKNLPLDSNSATLVKTIVKMTQELGIKVVSEGVETQEQYDFLVNQKSHFFQGYYFYRPMKFEKLSKLI